MKETELGIEKMLIGDESRKMLQPEDQVVVSISRTLDLPIVCDTFYNCDDIRNCREYSIQNILSESKIERYEL